VRCCLLAFSYTYSRWKEVIRESEIGGVAALLIAVMDRLESYGDIRQDL